MPSIKPFCALRPNATLQDSMVTRPLENYSLGEARLIASENPHNFLHLINPALDNQYLRGSRQELVYKKIAENLESFVESNALITEAAPAIYIYRVIHDDMIQTGLWTLTHINDYLSGKIKKHELTVERREKALSEYLQQTGLDANPVLITYPPVAIVDQLIDAYVVLKPDIEFTLLDGTNHQLWVIKVPADLEMLTRAFDAISSVYIADGHHRIAAMAKMALHKRSITAGNETANFNYFSTAYFSTAQIKVLAFNRLIKDLGELTVTSFLNAIEKSFDLIKADGPVKPVAMHEFGMYVNATWYRLIAKPGIYNEQHPVDVLDVSILQNFILEPILKIKDPRTDARITFEGEKTPVAFLQQQVDNGNYQVVFTLYPTSVAQLMAVADADGVMPPKSTWVEPKFLVGMLTNHFA